MFDRAFLARWGLLLATVALAVLFVGVTAWSDHGLRARTDDLLRVEGSSVLQKVGAQLHEAGLNPTGAEGIETALQPENAEASGVLWLALVDPSGRVLAEAGDRGGLDTLPDDIGAVVVAHGRARMMAPPGPPPRRNEAGPGAPPSSDRRPPPRIVLDFEPTLARDLQARTAQALAVALLGAVVLVGLAGFSWRARVRMETAEREVARTQHLAALGQMSAVLAHELRNPLTALKGHAQLLVEGAEPGRKRRRAERVVRSAERLEDLTNDLLAFARTAELQRSETTADAPVVAALEGLSADRVDIRGDRGAVVSIDLPRMTRVLANLLSNGLQHAPDDTRVDVEVTHRSGVLVYRVRDHGPGVPEDQRERIFEPFVTGRQRGTGLGLAVARRICQLHGGTLHVTEADGPGACFVAHIPEA